MMSRENEIKEQATHTEPKQIITADDLIKFMGSERHHLDYLGLRITDGVKFFKDKCEANWLISDIASVYYCDKKILSNKREGNTFLLVILKLNREKKTAVLTFQEDTDTEVLYKQQYKWTDLTEHYSEQAIKFYLIDGVLILPSEY